MGYFAFGHHGTTLLRAGLLVPELNGVEAELFKLTGFERDRCESVAPSEWLGGIVESFTQVLSTGAHIDEIRRYSFPAK